MRHYLLFRARDKARLLHSEGMERPKEKLVQDVVAGQLGSMI